MVSPRISRIQVWIRADTPLEELKQLHWANLEEAVLSFDPVPFVELIVENAEGVPNAKVIFKWLLEVVPKGEIMPRAQETEKLVARFALSYRRQDYRNFDYITTSEVFSAESEYRLHGGNIVLTPPNVFDLMVCDKDKKEDLLRYFKSLGPSSPS